MGRSLAYVLSPWAKEEQKSGRKDVRRVDAKDARLKILSIEEKIQSTSLNKGKETNAVQPPTNKNLIPKTAVAENVWRLSQKLVNLAFVKCRRKWEWLNFQQKAAKYVVALDAILVIILNPRVDL